jgi:heavy metal sensor kinase
VRVFDAGGNVTFDTSTPLDVPLDEDAVRDALDGKTATGRIDANETFRTHYAPILRDGAVVGALEVARTDDDVRETLGTLLLILGISYPATLVVASLGGVFLAGRALAPIDKMTRVAQRLSAEDLSQRLDLSLPDDELGRLARTFDDMLDRLDLSFRRQRQFTADASHELRTPLTAIKGQVEVALSRERDGATYREVLGAVNDEVDRLIRLVASLLTLARADAGQIALAREAVDAGELAGGAVEHVRPLARERDIDVQLEPGPQATIRGDHDLLLQLMLNLLDNAIKYTERGGRVQAGWRTTAGGIELWVRDSGPGIAEEHLPHLFDRFYRVDKARSRAAGGAGLGLSISRWIAEAHGGTISAASRDGEGATFAAIFPRS